jgi:hypothetical protein
MTELITGILGTTCLCGIGYMLVKICSLRDELQIVSPEYVLLSKEQYDCLKNNPDIKIVYEQPQMHEQPQITDRLLPEQPQLPSYSESAPPLIAL